MDLFKLLGTIAIENTGANSALKETQGHASNTAEAVQDASDKSDSAGSAMSSAFKKVGSAVVTFLAVDKVVAFGQGCIQAAADVAAMDSQFTQVFGNMEGQASNSLSKIADEAGISENRMKGSFTQIAAFAKTTGMDTETALGLSERAMVAVADSAAFYDRSLEDTTESLQSFLKGNYENDAALGLSCTETTRNAAANKLYGKSFKDLSEEQKQLTLLKMVEDANKASGALGQAARESNTWTNQTGNLKQAWTDFQAVLGGPILQAATNAVGWLAEKVATLTQKFSEGQNPVQMLVDKISGFWSWCQQIGGYIGSTLQPIFSDLQTAFTAVKDAVQPLIDKFNEYVSSGQASEDITNAVKTAIDLVADAYSKLKGFVQDVVQGFKDMVQWGKENETILQMIAIAVGTLTTAIVAYNIAQAIKNAGGIAELAQLALLQVQIWGLTAAETAHTVATNIATAATSAFGAVMSFVTSPITLVILAIGALIAIVVLCVKHWDDIKAAALKAWEEIKAAWNAVAEWFNANVIKPLVKFFKGLWNDIKNIWNSIKESVSNAMNTMKTNMATAWNAIKTTVSTVVNAIKNVIVTVWNAIRNTISTVLNAIRSVITSIWNGIKSVVTSVMNGIKNTVTNIWNSVKSSVSNAINGVKSAISNGLNSAKSIVSNVLSGIKDKFSSVFNTVKSTVSNAIEKIKGLVDFDWSLPKLKTPHFSVSGGEAPWGFGGKGKLPSVGVEWYEKAMNEPMIMTKPTIFDYNSATGKFMGGGEAGSEVVSGTNTLMNMISAAVSGQNTEFIAVLYKILEAILAMDENMGGNMRDALEGMSWDINRREFARLVKAVN